MTKRGSGDGAPLSSLHRRLKGPLPAADTGDVESVRTLLVVPAHAESNEEIEPILQTLVSLTTTAPDAMVLVVDDRSSALQAQMIEAAADELNCAYVRQQDGEGVYAAYNVGLAAAAQHDMDVCLVASGLVLDAPGWLERLRARIGTDGLPAASVGGAVINPSGMIRQAGFFFSYFRRAWSARLRNVPRPLLDAGGPLLCPVGSDLQFIRRQWIDTVEPFDERLSGSDADLDFCQRLSEAGGEVILDPAVQARGLTEVDAEPKPGTTSAGLLRFKHASTDFKPWVPEII
jgi:glycosyltransferase involved in cell wall biosynthesis